MKMKIITIFIIVIAQTITQVFCYARESCKELHETSSSISNLKEGLQSSADDGYISFTLDNESQKTLSYGFGTWNHYKGYKYTTVSAFDSSFSEKIIIAFDSNSKGTYRISKKHLLNQIHYYNEDGELWVAAATAGKGTVKVKYYGSVGDFISGTFSGILMDYFSNSNKQQKSETTWTKHKIRGTFKVKRLSNIEKSVSNKTGIAGINGLDSISANRTSENTSIINTTIKVPFHHSTPTLLPVPTPSSQPTSSPGKGCVVYGTVIDSYEDTLGGVTVTITGEGISESTETDEDGYYEFQGLAAGDYTLTYEKEGYVTQTQEISLEEGEEKDLGTVTMSQMCSIYGYAEPPVRICLIVNGLKKCKYPDEDGYFEFTGLEAGTYLIFLRAKGYLPKKIRVKLKEGEEEDVGEIILRRKS